MATTGTEGVPEGFYRGKNGRLYPAKQKSLLQRTAEALSAQNEALAAQIAIEQESEEDKVVHASFRSSVGTWPDSFEVIEAPTSEKFGKDTRNRALQVGWHAASKTLVVVFRDPVRKDKATGLWVPTGAPPPVFMYDGVDKSMWDDLKGSDSTGRFLKETGLDDSSPTETTFAGLLIEFS